MENLPRDYHHTLQLIQNTKRITILVVTTHV